MKPGDPPPLITECPNCHTRFRVGESQLQMAHGRVRCGACLAVFAGVDHLLLDEEIVFPEMSAESNMLESVLAELAVDDVPEMDPPEPGRSSARAFELDALEAQRENTREIAARAEAAGELSHADTEEVADWTSVAVDTREFGREDTLELAGRQSGPSFDESAVDATFEVVSDAPPRNSRATMEEALDNEEALRWWLEDELPDAAAGGDFVDEDEMVVQLSPLAAVTNEEQLDLQTLIGAADGDEASEQALAALFEELPDPAERSSLDSALDTEQPRETQTPTLEVREVEVGATDGDQAAEELARAIDEAEPLVSRAMANGTIAAAARKLEEQKLKREQEAQRLEEAMNEALSKTEKAATQNAPNPPPQRLEDKPAEPAAAELQLEALDADVRTIGGNELNGAVELVESPHPVQAAEPEPAVEAKQAKSAVEARAESPASITDGLSKAGEDEDQQPAGFGAAIAARWSGLLRNVNQVRAVMALAFLGLGGLIFYSQFDDWAKTATLRPLYANWCAVAGCELPVRRSVQQLQSRKLAVRSHPDKDDTLLVDVLIVNEAEYEQPFPLIELQFMDINQQVVGSYQLAPAEYLDGELAGSNALMAVRTPVHVDIDIPDPGPKAVNYQLQFR